MRRTDDERYPLAGADDLRRTQVRAETRQARRQYVSQARLLQDLADKS